MSATPPLAPRTSDPAPRVVVITAPSGAGKTTIARRLLAQIPGLRFSVSATTRPPRPHEQDGVDYHFVSVEDFHRLKDEGALIEWEEVYPGRFYGTPHAELARLTPGGALLLDVDVKGALHIKELFGANALTIFVAPPSLAVLEERLRARGTETDKTLHIRLAWARDELTYAPRFDHVVVNERLDTAVAETLALVRSFLAA
jgi:guanylate kinase